MTDQPAADDRNRDEATDDLRLLKTVLVCPLDQGQLNRQERHFICQLCGRTYPVRDGIADMTLRPDE
jgi:uncharacterized protein YbaR (Trm112 family)